MGQQYPLIPFAMKKPFFLLAAFAFALFLPQAQASMPAASTLSGKIVVNQVTLNWTKSTAGDFKFYKVVRGTLNNLPEYPDLKEIFSTDKISDLSFSQSVDLSTNYYYRVCTVNTGNEVSCSNILQIAPDRTVTSHKFFSDVESGSWYEPFVEDLYRLWVLSTANSTYFYPAEMTSRGKMAEMMVKAIVTDESSLSTVQYFCDVPASHPQAKYINHLRTLGVVQGYLGGTCASKRNFNPSAPVNRAEAGKMILLTFGVDPDSSAISDDTSAVQNTNIFLDVRQQDWFASYVWRLKKDGIVSGYPDDTFRPENKLINSEIAKIVYNAVKFYKK